MNVLVLMSLTIFLSLFANPELDMFLKKKFLQMDWYRRGFLFFAIFLLLYGIYGSNKKEDHLDKKIERLQDGINELQTEMHELKEESGYYSKDSDVVSE